MRAFILTLCLFLLNSSSTAFACTRDEAFNKMMALGRARQALMNQAGRDRSRIRTAVDLAKETADVGKVLAAEKYSEACGYYDKIAAKYGVDLNEAAKGMITMEQIRKDGGRNGGACSQSDAAKKLASISEDIQDKVALGDQPASAYSEFAKEVQKNNDLMSTDPSAFCAKLDQLNKKYNSQ